MKENKIFTRKRFCFRVVLYIAIAFSTLFFTCKESDCVDCESELEGFLFKRVTDSDIPLLYGISGIQIEDCIRYKIDLDQIDPGSVTIVDDCCCQ